MTRKGKGAGGDEKDSPREERVVREEREEEGGFL